MSVETQAEILVVKVLASDNSPSLSAEIPAAVGDRLRELIAKLMANMENIDAQEAAALLSQATVMVTAFASGSMIAGFVAFLEFMRMYRKAVASIPTATV